VGGQGQLSWLQIGPRITATKKAPGLHSSGAFLFGGATQSRTGLDGFAIRCITALLSRQNHALTKMGSRCFPCGCKRSAFHQKTGAGNEIRTRDLNLGKVALYQLSYSRRIKKEKILDEFFRTTGAGNEIRTRDLNLGKVALYQLSYSRKLSKAVQKKLHLKKTNCNAI
jgi:hypothetical protein